MKSIMVVILFLSFTVLAAPKKEKPWKVDAEKLKSKVSKQFKKNKSTEKYSLSELKDLDVFKEMKETMYILNMGLHDTSGFSELSKYGIKKRKDKGFEINLIEHPRWLTIDKLFLPLGSLSRFPEEEISREMEELRTKGFKLSDINKLTNFLSSRDLRAEKKAVFDELTRFYGDIVRDNYKSGVDNIEVIYQYGMETSKSSYNLRREWSLDLLNLFSKHQQRILVSHYSSKFRVLGIQADPPFEKMAPELEKLFITNRI